MPDYDTMYKAFQLTSDAQIEFQRIQKDANVRRKNSSPRAMETIIVVNGEATTEKKEKPDA